MKYKFANYQLVYVNDNYITKVYGVFDSYDEALEANSILVEYATYIYGIIDKDQKVLLHKVESDWIKSMHYLEYIK
jgi:hypothetical protein